MIELPAGMQEKINSRFQTIHGGAQPEMRVMLYGPPTAPDYVTEWGKVEFVPMSECSYGDHMPLYVTEDYVYCRGSIAGVSRLHIYARGTKTWSNVNLSGLPTDLAPNAIWALSPSQIWLGSGSRIGGAIGNHGVYYWNGSTWSERLVACHATCIVGSSADRIWVGGYNGIYHWNGASWIHQLSGWTYKMRMTRGNPNDIWAGGVYTWTAHYDGTSWTYRNAGFDPPNIIYSIGGLPDGTAYCVAEELIAFVVYKYSPSTNNWTLFKTWPLKADCGYPQILVFAHNDIWIAGTYVSENICRWRVQHYDGTNWNGNVFITAEYDTSLKETSHFDGTSKNNLWFVGRALQSPAPQVGAYRVQPPPDKPEIFDMRTDYYWKEDKHSALGTGKHWTDITAASRRHVWACNEEGQIYRHNGRYWSKEKDSEWCFTSIFAADDTHVWCCGWKDGQHVILFSTGNGVWIEPPDPRCHIADGRKLTYIWGGSPWDVWCIGQYGLRLHYHNGAWHLDRGDNSELYHQHEHIRLVGRGINHVWSVGHGGRVFLYNGQTWNDDETYFVDSDIDLENVTIKSYWYWRATGTKGGYPVMLEGDGAGGWRWVHIGPLGLDPGWANGVWALGAHGEFWTFACGDSVLFTGFAGESLKVQEVENGIEPRQFWHFGNSLTWLVGVGGSGIWRYSPPDEIGTDISKYLETGDLRGDKENPCRSLSLEMMNPDGYLVAEESRLAGAGYRLELAFRIGNTAWLPLGSYLIDRVEGGVLDATVGIDARGELVKHVLDQSLDADRIRPRDAHLSDLIEWILIDCGFYDGQFEICPDMRQIDLDFDLQMPAHQAIQDILAFNAWWKTEERYDRKLIIGPPPGTEGYSDWGIHPWTPTGNYNFERGTDIWSRKIETEDREVFRRIVVETEPTQVDDELLGFGDGVTATFRADHYPIVPESERVTVDEIEKQRGEHYTIDYSTGTVTFLEIPPDTSYSPNRHLINSYSIELRPSGYGCPGVWRLWGSNDGVNWVTLHSVGWWNGWTGQLGTPWTGEKFFNCTPGEYRIYRLQIIKCHYVSGMGTLPNIVQIRFYDGEEDVTPEMTAHALPEPNVVSAWSEWQDGSGIRHSWWAFDGDSDTWWIAGHMHPTEGNWISLDYGGEITEGRSAIRMSYETQLNVIEPVPVSPYATVRPLKSLYIPIPGKTPVTAAQRIATEAVELVKDAGKAEVFVGPIRPQLWPGDGAVISPGGPKGTITTFLHRFGKPGFSTEFTVDSAQRTGKPTVAEMVDRIASRYRR